MYWFSSNTNAIYIYIFFKKAINNKTVKRIYIIYEVDKEVVRNII